MDLRVSAVPPTYPRVRVDCGVAERGQDQHHRRGVSGADSDSVGLQPGDTQGLHSHLPQVRGGSQQPRHTCRGPEASHHTEVDCSSLSVRLSHRKR